MKISWPKHAMKQRKFTPSFAHLDGLKVEVPYHADRSERRKSAETLVTSRGRGVPAETEWICLRQVEVQSTAVVRRHRILAAHQILAEDLDLRPCAPYLQDLDAAAVFEFAGADFDGNTVLESIREETRGAVEVPFTGFLRRFEFPAIIDQRLDRRLPIAFLLRFAALLQRFDRRRAQILLSLLLDARRIFRPRRVNQAARRRDGQRQQQSRCGFDFAQHHGFHHSFRYRGDLDRDYARV